MKKIIRLTESDLARIVKRVLNETDTQSARPLIYSKCVQIDGLGPKDQNFFSRETIQGKDDDDIMKKVKQKYDLKLKSANYSFIDKKFCKK